MKLFIDGIYNCENLSQPFCCPAQGLINLGAVKLLERKGIPRESDAMVSLNLCPPPTGGIARGGEAVSLGWNM